MLFEKFEPGEPPRATAESGRGVIDALVLDDNEVWPVVAREGEDLDELLYLDDGVAPLRVCRSFRTADILVLDDADPARDSLLSDLDGRERGAEE